MQQRWVKNILILVLVGAIAGVTWQFRAQLNLDTLTETVVSWGWWAPVLFMGLYALGTVLFLPGSILTLAGGLLFGPWWGTLYNLIGATTGAVIAFLIARYLGRDWIAAKVGGRLQKLMTGIDREGWRFVAVMRLVPLIPFNLLNYALGLTRIGVYPYALSSFLAMLPGCFAYTYAGSLGQAFLQGDGFELIQKGLFALGLFVFIGGGTWWLKRRRGQITQKESS